MGGKFRIISINWVSRVMKNTTKFPHIGSSTFNQLVKKYPITLIILFGSAVEGNWRKGSDIDIGIYLNDKMEVKKEINLIEDLVHIFKNDNIDPVILNFASPLLLFEVIKKGRLLFEKKGGGFLQFKLLAMKKYWEYSKFRKYRKKYLDKKEKGLSFV